MAEIEHLTWTCFFLNFVLNSILKSVFLPLVCFKTKQKTLPFHVLQVSNSSSVETSPFAHSSGFADPQPPTEEAFVSVKDKDEHLSPH